MHQSPWEVKMSNTMVRLPCQVVLRGRAPWSSFTWRSVSCGLLPRRGVGEDHGQAASDVAVYQVCIYMHVYMCVHVCVYMCMCTCMYMYICVSVYMYAYTCICTRVWVYICTRVGAFCLFVLSHFCTTCVCTTGVFQHQHACVVGDWKWGFFQLVRG